MKQALAIVENLIIFVYINYISQIETLNNNVDYFSRAIFLNHTITLFFISIY